MNPIDLRNETWESLQGRIVGLRLQVLAAWRENGPDTTRRLAARAGLDLLGVRPRTTELVDMGLLRMVDREGHEGVDAAVPEDEVREHLLKIKGGNATQTLMKL